MITKRALVTGIAAGAIVTASGIPAISSPLATSHDAPTKVLDIVWDQEWYHQRCPDCTVEDAHAALDLIVYMLIRIHKIDAVIVSPMGLTILDYRTGRNGFIREDKRYRYGNKRIGFLEEISVYLDANEYNVTKLFREGFLIAMITMKNIRFV